MQARSVMVVDGARAHVRLALCARTWREIQNLLRRMCVEAGPAEGWHPLRNRPAKKRPPRSNAGAAA